ncbi:MAG: hypothetical protein HY904_03040 [Deltaproteobacteria bacterium]|nr:hypothetical protein [Deltaproteobacteria bacterium]
MPRARERTGIRLPHRNVLKIELDGGLLLDSNPTNSSLSNQARLLRGELRTSSPGLGVFLGRSIAWSRERRRYSAALAANARAWGSGYLAPVTPAVLAGTAHPRPPGNVWPQGRFSLDLSIVGGFTWRTRHRGQLTSSVALVRTNLPTPEQLGLVQGRTTLLLTQAWQRVSPRRTWITTLRAGIRGEALDDIALDLSTWKLPSRDQALPISLGGGGLTADGTVERRLSARHALYARGQVATAAFVRSSRLLSLAVPVAAVAGWASVLRPDTTLRLEAGAWLPNSLCPNPAMVACVLPLRTDPSVEATEATAWAAAAAWAPQPVALLQLEQALGRRWLLSVRLVKDGRSTALYSFVDDKRLDVSLTGLPARAWQVRLSSSVALLSYGAPADPATFRSRVPWPGLAAPSPVDRLGRQDFHGTLDGSVRWVVRPWLVLSAQQSLLLLLTTSESRGADGKWHNPSLARGLTGASVLLQW